MDNYIEIIKTEIAKLNLNDVAIAQISKEYLALKVEGIEDKKGLQAVHDARMYVKGKRIEIEKKRKELKADSIAYGKAVDAEAQRLTAQLEPIETYLQEEEEKVEAEKRRIKEAEERAEAERMRGRVVVLLEMGAQFHSVESQYILGEVAYSVVDLKNDTQEQFEKMVALFTEQAETIAQIKREAEEKAEKERLEREAKEAEAEAERKRLVAEEEARLKSEREALAEKERQQAEERRKLNEEKAEAERKAQEERDRIASERAAFEAEKQRDAEEKKRLQDIEDAKILAEEKAKRAEELKPDKEKILAFLKNISTIIFAPKFTSQEAENLTNEMLQSLQEWVRKYEEKVSNL